MKAQFFDRQDGSNALHGRTVEDPDEVPAIVASLRQREPFFAELVGEDGCRLMLGLGSADGCVQFSTRDGERNFVAVGDVPAGDGEQNFLIANTPTPVPRRWCLPMESVADIAAEFLRNGERATSARWEEI